MQLHLYWDNETSAGSIYLVSYKMFHYLVMWNLIYLILKAPDVAQSIHNKVSKQVFVKYT